MRKAALTLAAVATVVGAAGLSMVKEHEGLRTRAYLDPVGIPTICYGHTGPEVKLGMVWSKERCEAVLLEDLRKHDAAMHRCVKVPLTQGQHDATLSIFFNVGSPKMCKSTLVRKLNAGDYRGAAIEFPKWKNGTVNGKLTALPGLVKRRAHEQALFLSPTPKAVHGAPTGNLRALLADAE